MQSICSLYAVYMQSICSHFLLIHCTDHGDNKPVWPTREANVLSDAQDVEIYYLGHTPVLVISQGVPQRPLIDKLYLLPKGNYTVHNIYILYYVQAVYKLYRLYIYKYNNGAGCLIIPRTYMVQVVHEL
jgi:hypothetical protein